MTSKYEEILASPEETLPELLARLERVRSWGGAYSEIELSPFVQVILKRQCRAQRTPEPTSMAATV